MRFSKPDFDLIETDREYLYLFDTNYAYHVPEALRDKILSEDAFYDLIDSLVRPSSYDCNLAEWRLFSNFDPVPSYYAECAWAVRCVEGHNEVASVVTDNHGRVAMNIAFTSVEDYLKAELEWQNTRPTEMPGLNI